jgi:hypothetical protein
MTYTFKLYRRSRNPKTGGVIISAFNLDRECEDPFRERMKLCREFPRWAIGSDFASTTDKEYDAVWYDSEVDEYFEVNETEDWAKSAENDEELDHIEDHWAKPPKTTRKIEYDKPVDGYDINNPRR